MTSQASGSGASGARVSGPEEICSSSLPRIRPPVQGPCAHALPFCQVYETPFYVAVDHDKKKVVISIRGTLSPKVRRPGTPPRPGPPHSPWGRPTSFSLLLSPTPPSSRPQDARQT